jgi:hypothetical protein
LWGNQPKIDKRIIDIREKPADFFCVIPQSLFADLKISAQIPALPPIPPLCSAACPELPERAKVVERVSFVVKAFVPDQRKSAADGFASDDGDVARCRR